MKIFREKSNWPIIGLATIVLLITIAVIGYSIYSGFYSKESNYQGIVVEFHGIILEVIILGILFTLVVAKLQKQSSRPMLNGFYKDFINQIEDILEKIIQIAGDASISINKRHGYNFGSHIIFSKFSEKEIGLDKSLYETAHRLAKGLKHTA